MSSYNNKHTRNKSLNENELIDLYYSPRPEKKKLWASSNNLQNLDSEMFESGILSPRKNIIKRRTGKTPDYLSIDIENVGNIIENYTLSSSEEDKNNLTIHEDSEISLDNKKNGIFNDPNLYIRNLMGYFYYLILSLLGTIIINVSTGVKNIIPLDSIIFLYLSPVFYKLCFREIFFYSLKENKNIIKYIYPFSIITGFCIRLLDYIPFFSRFVLNTDLFVNTPEYIALFCVFLCYLFGVFFNELYKSTYRKLNFCFLVFGGLIIYFTLSYNIQKGYIIHVHHYFVGLIFHMVCQTKKSTISVINNGMGLGVFLEGISKWGFGSLYYRY